MQYAYCVALGSDRIAALTSEYEETLSRDQLDLAREIVIRIIVENDDGQRHQLIGGMREDGTRYVSASFSSRWCKPR